MRRILSLFLIFSVAVAFGKVNVSWLNTDYDFGLIKESEGIKTGEFRFVNKGRKAVKINDVMASCGCTAVEFPKENIKKGEMGIIKVKYDPTERPGRFDKGIYVYLKGEEVPVSLRIEGTVMASDETLQLFYPEGTGALRFDTGSVDFSEMKRGLRRREFVDFYNSGTKPITPVFHSDTNALRMEVEPATINPGETGTMKIYLDSSKLMWLGEKELNIEGDGINLKVRVKLTP